MSETIRLTMINETIVERECEQAREPDRRLADEHPQREEVDDQEDDPEDDRRLDDPRASCVEKPSKIAAERTMPTTMPISDDAIRIPQRASTTQTLSRRYRS